MILYLSFTFVIILAFTFLDLIKIPQKVKVIPWLLCFFLMWVALTFRSGRNDIQEYYRAFEAAPRQAIGNHMEIGYLYINSLFKFLGFNKYYFISIFGLIALSLQFRFFKKFTKLILFATLVYFSHAFLLREMLQIRAGMAIAIIMFAIPHIANRNLLKFSLIVLFASTIHFSAMFFFGVYFAYPYVNEIKTYIKLLVLCLIIGVVLNINFFIFLSKYIDNYKLQAYLLDGRFNKGIGLLNPVLLKNYIVIGILLYNYDFFDERIPFFKVMLVSYLFSACWLSAFNSFTIFAARIATLFANVEHVLIPSLLLLPRKRFFIYMGVVAYCVFIFIYNLDSFKEFMNFDFSWL